MYPFRWANVPQVGKHWSSDSGPGLGKVGQGGLKVLHLWRHSQNACIPQPPNFFECKLQDLLSLLTGSVALTGPEKFPCKAICDPAVFFTNRLNQPRWSFSVKWTKKIGEVNPPSQIFLKFHKQKKMFMLIPKNLILLKLIKVLQSYGPYNMTTSCGQWSVTTSKKIIN